VIIQKKANMEKIKIEINGTTEFIDSVDYEHFMSKVSACNKMLHEKTGKGSDFLGWVSLPHEIKEDELIDIQETASNLRKIAEVVVVIGIGGSYLGARAVIDALSDSFEYYYTSGRTRIVYAGQNISEDYLFELKQYLKSKKWAIIVISKSGTTTEPAIAFRILKNELEQTFGKKDSIQRIVAITDKSKGALRKLAISEGFKTFVISDDIGGRYSVLSPVGLLPIAVAGFNINQMVNGAKLMADATSPKVEAKDNPAAIYAAVRNCLYKKGKRLEILVNYNPKLHYIAEWWKQLFGESEGKEGKGIFPASVDFSSDLHSMGQYIQEGIRNLFETVISIKKCSYRLTIPGDKQDLDGLNFIQDKRIDEVNKMAELGTRLAHIEGGVPNIRIEIPKIDETYLGQLIYFFEKACGLSGYMLDVNPFDQPGVEAYKRNMFALLGKPGYEKAGAELEKLIKGMK
jgi:glucose-6-phosphate isomerase